MRNTLRAHVESSLVCVPIRIIFLLLFTIIPLSLYVSSLQAATFSFDEISAVAKQGTRKSSAFSSMQLGNIFAGAQIPQRVVPIFQNVELKTPTVLPAPAGYDLGFTLVGSIIFQGNETKATLIGVQDHSGKREYSLGIEVPHDWKLSSFLPELKQLDSLNLPKVRIILSSWDYVDAQAQVSVTRGLNFLAELELTGPLQFAQTFLDKMKTYLHVRGGQAVLQGVIASNITESLFHATIPAQISVDLEQLYKDGKLKTSPAPLKKIGTGDLVITIAPADLGFKIGSSIILELTTQQKPLEFRAEVTFSAQKVRFDGYSIGTYDPAFGLQWLAIDEFGMFVEIDYAAEEVLLAVGIPFTGIGFRGGLGLGAGTDRTNIDLAAAVEVSSTTVGNIVFDGSITKIDIARLTQLLTKMVGKEIPLKQIPVIQFTNLRLLIALMDSFVGGKQYHQGFTLSGAWEIWKIQGSIFVEILTSTQSLLAQGWLKNIETPVIRIIGTEKDKKEYNLPDDGWFVKVHLSPVEQIIAGSAALEIPPLKLQGSADLHFSDVDLKAHVLFKVAQLFDAEFNIVLDALNPQNFDAHFDLKQNFADFVNKELPKALAKLKQQNMAEMKQYDAQINSTQTKINQIKGSLNAQANAQINDVNAKIAQIDATLNSLNNDCNNAPWYQKVGNQSCLAIAGKQAEKGSLIAYRETLKGGTQIAQGSLTAVNQLSSQIDQWNSLKKITQKLIDFADVIGNAVAQGIVAINIKRAAGQVSGKDIAAGRLAKLIELTIELNIPNVSKKEISLKNLELNFADVEQSVITIIQAIIKKAAQ